MIFMEMTSTLKVNHCLLQCREGAGDFQLVAGRDQGRRLLQTAAPQRSLALLGRPR